MLYHPIKEQLQARLWEGGGQGKAKDCSHIICPLGSLDVTKAIMLKNSLSFRIETNAVLCELINLHFKISASKDLPTTYYAHIVGLGDGSAETSNKQDLFLAF